MHSEGKRRKNNSKSVGYQRYKSERETKYSGEGKVKLVGIPGMGHSQIYTKIISSPKRHMLACIKPNPEF
jgi:ribosome-interacting GTPase 1